jgi:hypothetical protein
VTYIMEDSLRGVPWKLVTDPDPTNVPTDNYDITITDRAGSDVLLGKGADRDTATNEVEWICDATITEAHTMVDGPVTFVVGSAGDTKSGIATLSLIRPEAISSPARLY